MKRGFSDPAVREYLPAIKTVLASTEVGLARYPDLAGHDSLRTLHLEKELGSSQLTHAMHIMDAWLEGTKFKADFRFFHKLEPGADWNDMVVLLNDKASSYDTVSAGTGAGAAHDRVGPVTQGVPDGAVWDDIEIRFLNAHEVMVLHKGKALGKYGYEQLEFATGNTKDHRPNKGWNFLAKLSIAAMKSAGKQTVGDIAARMHVTKGACAQIKKSTSEKLRTAFGIDADPFYDYAVVHEYRPKFKLVPESALRGDGELHRSGRSLRDDDLPEDDED